MTDDLVRDPIQCLRADLEKVDFRGLHFGLPLVDQRKLVDIAEAAQWHRERKSDVSGWKLDDALSSLLSDAPTRAPDDAPVTQE